MALRFLSERFSSYSGEDILQGHVAPFVGAWIEMAGVGMSPSRTNVASLVSAWIETHRLGVNKKTVSKMIWFFCCFYFSSVAKIIVFLLISLYTCREI
ncbi:hypothetical protein AC241_32390 (plasmid) [Bacillus thuringiensis]|uniref:hypothetical protein n=1 Tax=Bacillus thuringiensis TaxID=1428 RepID=UPI000676E2A4|nr:hypothetical protein [Bacillus thuringiensis]AKR13347.1 hypothetical protein AC241_32390 [Bacillus thuringiensis]